MADAGGIANDQPMHASGRPVDAGLGCLGLVSAIGGKRLIRTVRGASISRRGRWLTATIRSELPMHRALTTLEVLVIGLVIINDADALLNWLRIYSFAHTSSRMDAVLGSLPFQHLKRTNILMTKSSNITNAASARFLPIVAIALALALTGCVTDQSPAARVATAPAAGPIPPGQAAITITRVDGYFAKAVAADVDVNGSKFTSIDMGATFTGFVRPGPVALSVSCWCGPGRYTVNFKAEAGRRYAFEVASRNEQAGAMFAAGMIGLAVDTVANGETSGTFKLTEVAGGR